MTPSPLIPVTDARASSVEADRATLAPRLSTLLLIIGTTAGATFTILVAGGAGPQSLVVRIVYDAMAAIVLIPWLVVAFFRPDWRPASQLMPALLVILAVFAVSTVTSRVPRLSLEMLGYVFLLVGVYLLLVTLMRRPEIRAHFERLALVMCVVVCGLYLLQVGQLWAEWWGLIGRLAIPPMRPAYSGLNLGSPNPLATLVMMLGGFALATNRLLGRPGQVVGVIVIGLVTVTTFITTSRGAWLGAASGLVVALGVAVLTRPDFLRQRARSLLRSRRGIVIVSLGLSMLALGGILAALTGRLTLEDGGYRAGFVRASLRMFESAPVTGVGPGTWGVLRASNMASSDPDQYIPHAHNLYIQTLAEFGLMGVVAAVLVVGWLAVLIASAIRSDDPSRRRVACAAAFAIVLFAAQQVGDVLVNVPALLLALALPIAWLDATAASQPAEKSRHVIARPTLGMRALPLGGAVLTCIVLVGLVRIESATATAERGVASANAGAWPEAMSLIGEAAAADPDLAVYRFELGVSAANAGDLGKAETSLSMSAASDDYPYAWLNLAAVRWDVGDHAGALDALARAERVGLQRPGIAIAAGWLRQQLGDQQAATVDYATVITQVPTLVDDPFWSSSRGPRGGLAAILPAIDERASPETRLQIDLILGRFDDAQADISTLDLSPPALYANLIAAWRGDPSAWIAVQTRAATQPLNVTLAGWCRLVAAHLGDTASAQKYASWLSILNSSDSGQPAIARIVFGSAQTLPQSGLDRYGSLYRRDVLAAQVISLLPQLVWTNDPPASASWLEDHASRAFVRDGVAGVAR